MIGRLSPIALWRLIVLVAFTAPFVHLLASIVHIHKPVLAQAFQAHSGFEAFCEDIIRGPARSWEVQGDAIGLGQQIELFRRELTPLIDADIVWESEVPTRPFQSLYHGLCGGGSCYAHDGANAAPRVDDGQYPDALDVEKLIIHPVNYPYLVRAGGIATIIAQLSHDASPWRLYAGATHYAAFVGLPDNRADAPA